MLLVCCVTVQNSPTKGHFYVYCVTSYHNTLRFFYGQGLRPHTTTRVLILLIAASQVIFCAMVKYGLRHVLEKQLWALLILGLSVLGMLGSVSSLALYQHSTTSPSYQVMGNMVFDRVSICWKNLPRSCFSKWSWKIPDQVISVVYLWV